MVQHDFEEASRTPHASITPPAEWLLDNYYIIRQALQQIKQDMPADFYARLPKTSIEENNEMARIYILARALVSASQSHLKIEDLNIFIRAYQSVCPLKIGEIWAFATMLRLCVLEMLASALAEMQGISFESHYPLPVFRFDGENVSETESQLPSPETLVPNCIISLRILNTRDWKAFFEETSLLETVLAIDPIYAQMDFATRNRYRNVIEQLSLNTHLDEQEIARAAIALAEKGETPRERHVGYYLIGPGRFRFEAECNYHVPIQLRRCGAGSR